MRKNITKEELEYLEGILLLSRKYYNKLTEMEDLIRNILELNYESDKKHQKLAMKKIIFSESGDINSLLKNLDIKVVDSVNDLM